MKRNSRYGGSETSWMERLRAQWSGVREDNEVSQKVDEDFGETNLKKRRRRGECRLNRADSSAFAGARKGLQLTIARPDA